ncbi:hypothetical protein N7519_002684 [Penicillium mononematosum]|uniref:uncharacterized protein n=1 Tax=Penicillium mononematosum TaxID=268346 RepID=UPI0025489A49|nr:uncharacterized protein N7519_002684 [Penicillium mononematosum]KAJ6187776.1 hypothetical protein N7519_002684 [Penicillium mononematosum]
MFNPNLEALDIDQAGIDVLYVQGSISDRSLLITTEQEPLAKTLDQSPSLRSAVGSRRPSTP